MKINISSLRNPTLLNEVSETFCFLLDNSVKTIEHHNISKVTEYKAGETEHSLELMQCALMSVLMRDRHCQSQY